MVSTRGKSVSLAPASCSVEITSDETSLNVVIHGGNGITSVATISARRAARNEILSGESDVLSEGNASSIRERFGSTEGPARTTVGLVSNLPKRRALRSPLLSSIEGIR